jgi:predicted DNA-binding protein (MmcQ/YjbR family)
MANPLNTIIFTFFLGATISGFGMSLVCVHPDHGDQGPPIEITIGSIKSAHHDERYADFSSQPHTHTIRVVDDFCIDMLVSRCKIRTDRNSKTAPPSFFYSASLLIQNIIAPSFHLNETNWRTLSIILLRTIVMLN